MFSRKGGESPKVGVWVFRAYGHQLRLCVCQAQTALLRVSRTALMRVSPNASIESARELASFADLCSLRSHVF